MRSVLLLTAFACACTSEQRPAPPPPPLAEPLEIGRVRITAVGDVMLHRAVKTSARDHATRDNHGGYDWVWADVRDAVQTADLALANLESPVAPHSHRGIWGEVFNASPLVLDSLDHTGFDLLTFANNHTFDQGPAGLVETLERIEAAGMKVVGSGRDCSQARAAYVREINGVRIAFLAMTDLMNYIIKENDVEVAECTFVTGPECKKDCGPDRDAFYYLVDDELVLGAIRAARANADAVVLSFHWGVEYDTNPLPLYRDLAPRLINAGVDVLLGHHPHVLQPIEWQTASDGRRGLIVYSLGNFVSGMGRTYNHSAMPVAKGHTRDGVLLELTVTKTRQPNGDTAVAIEEVRATPLWTENNHRVLAGGDTHVRVVTHPAAAGRRPAPGTATTELLGKRRDAIAAVVGEGWLAP